MGADKGNPHETRTPERLRYHYEVEKALAARLRSANRQERKRLYNDLYAELLAKVPDHPSLTRTANPEATKREIRQKTAMVRRFLRPRATFVEFAAGDAGFAMGLCRSAGQVLAVEVVDRLDPAVRPPPNFRLVIYDGVDLDIPDGTADVVFSDQLIEHLHPEDVESHFALVRRMLKGGGAYVFRTPHAFSGPHDISRYFSDRPEGFHLKEWTFRQIAGELRKAGFRRPRA